MSTFLEQRKFAIEYEIRLRLKELLKDGKILMGEKFETKEEIILGLDEAIKANTSGANIRRLKGLFTYDLQFHPVYAPSLKIKDKIEHIKKIIEKD